MILPRQLVQHLARSGRLEAAWAQHGGRPRILGPHGQALSWGANHPAFQSGSGRHVPMFLYLYGDDARFNSFGDKLVLVSCGFRVGPKEKFHAGALSGLCAERGPVNH